MAVKACAWCGASFSARGRSVACSEACRKAHRSASCKASKAARKGSVAEYMKEYRSSTEYRARRAELEGARGGVVPREVAKSEV